MGQPATGAGETFSYVLLNSAAQEEVPDAVLGRVLGVISFVHRGAHATGLLLISPLFAVAAARPLFGALSAGVTYVGRRALPYGERSDTIFTVDASATVFWKIFELGFMATNLFNRQYRLAEFNYASDFHGEAQPTLVPARHFAAGAPRGLFITLSGTLGGS